MIWRISLLIRLLLAGGLVKKSRGLLCVCAVNVLESELCFFVAVARCGRASARNDGDRRASIEGGRPQQQQNADQDKSRTLLLLYSVQSLNHSVCAFFFFSSQTANFWSITRPRPRPRPPLLPLWQAQSPKQSWGWWIDHHHHLLLCGPRFIFRVFIKARSFDVILSELVLRFLFMFFTICSFLSLSAVNHCLPVILFFSLNCFSR